MKNHLFLALWIVALIVIGGFIGSLTKPEISTWYSTLNRSILTPPNYIFPIVWAVLYGTIGACGCFIWRARSFPKLSVIKILYLAQLILNWIWTPLFFGNHLIGFSLIVLISMDILVCLLIYLVYKNIRKVALTMMPYFLWIVFASYLNFYIWRFN